MRFSLRSGKAPESGEGRHESSRLIKSERFAGVRYRIARISFGRRTELIRRIRDLARQMDYHSAGESVQDKIEAVLLGREIERLYVNWALMDIEGLRIDGEPATPSTLIDRGPEELVREISRAIQGECSLSEEERKN
jgi:hypothetical protein